MSTVVADSAVGRLLSDERVTKILRKYQRGLAAVNDISILIILMFPEADGGGAMDYQIDAVTAAVDGKAIETSINKHIQLAKKDGLFEIMNEATNTSYFQTLSGGIIIVGIISAYDDTEAGIALSESGCGFAFLFSFLELDQSDLGDDEVFIDIGEELLQGFEEYGLSDGLIEVYEFRDGEQISIY